jgi:hypothetical protein
MRFLIRDRDAKFCRGFDDVVRAEGAEVLVTTVQAPNANAYGERWVRSVRAECLEWLLVLGRGHLEQVLRIYIQHVNQHRPHRALGREPPGPSAGRTLGRGGSTSPEYADATSLAECFTSTNELPKRIYAPYGLLASYVRLYGIGLQPYIAAVGTDAATDDSFGKRGAWSDISTNYDNQLRA